MSLSATSLCAGYGSTEVLRGVSIVVPAGSFAVVLGANGAGKTTLLRACAGLLRPTAGTILVDGVDVTGASSHQLARHDVCLIPEGRAIFPGLTVAENLRLLAPASVEDPFERAATAFPLLGRKLGQTAGTMSGGEQQMLALARAYLRSPRYVLLDEPSMGLAPLVVDEIFAFLDQLAASGIALLLVEQYAHRALAHADLAYVLTKGRVGFAGEADEVDPDQLMDAYLAARRSRP